MRERVIETTQITKTYGKVLALDHVDICVKRGDIYGLIGDNGAGKSTLLKLLAGHSAASTGEIRLFGEQGEKELQRARRRSGVMIEQPGFFENLTVENNMEYYRIQKGVPGKEKVEEMLRMTGIWKKESAGARDFFHGNETKTGTGDGDARRAGAVDLRRTDQRTGPQWDCRIQTAFKASERRKEDHDSAFQSYSDRTTQLATVYGFLSKGRFTGTDHRRNPA